MTTNRRPDWHRLGQYVLARRTELGLTQEQLTAAGGPSTASLRLIEGGHQESYRLQTLHALDKSLGWATGSHEKVLRGGEPEVVPMDQRAAANDPDAGDFTHSSADADTVLMHLPEGALAGLSPTEREEAMAAARKAILQTAREIRRGLQ